MMQLILRKNKSLRIRILLAFQIIANLVIGMYFTFQIIYNCGIKFLFPSIVGFLVGLFHIYLQSSNRWNLKFLVFGVVLSILSLGAGITAFILIENEVLCESQFCVSRSFNSADFISDFKEAYPISCPESSDNIVGQMVLFSLVSPQYSDIGTIYYYPEFLSLVVVISSIVLAQVSIVLLALSIIARKPKDNIINQPLIP